MQKTLAGFSGFNNDMLDMRDNATAGLRTIAMDA